jgi:outer membrane protein TolC
VAQLGEIALAPRVRDDSEVDEARATDALARRSDVLAALARYAGAEAALQGEIAKQFPDLRIGSGYQWDQGQSKFLLGLSIDLPLLDQNEGAIAGALAARSVAAVEFDAVQMAALSEIEAARSERATALEHCAALRATTALVDEQAERADAALVAGALNRLDALAVRGLALRARRDRLEAESSLAVATRRLSASVALAPGEVDGIAGWFARGEQR